MKLSSTGPTNLLPAFFFSMGSEEGGAYSPGQGYSGGAPPAAPFIPPDHCPDDIFEVFMARGSGTDAGIFRCGCAFGWHIAESICV